MAKSFYRFLRRRLATPLARRGSMKSQKHPPLESLASQTLVVDVEEGLLRSSSLFPYFMLVAMEAGGFLRGLLLLLLYPMICCLTLEAALKVMVMVSFCGIKKDRFRAGRAVLPKFLLENVGLEGFEILRRARRRVCVSCMPRVMVEEFLKEFLEVEVVMARELEVFAGFYTGFMVEDERVKEGLDLKELFGGGGGGGEEEVGEDVVVFGCYSGSLQHHFFPHCKEVYMIGETEKRNYHPLPRSSYPKPLVFHDGRLAFLPTPAATLTMFMWLPFGISLSVFRSLVFMLLPNNLSIPFGALTGMKNRLIAGRKNQDPDSPRSHLYVCNHRTMLDPVYISAAVNKTVTAVTYSLSPVSEALSPVRTARLTRNKEQDRSRMDQLLAQGNLVVCPEGTTCREPYLLRFSPLFAELTDEIVPVALVARVSMFYGTTASGFKWLDPFYFLMNPRPEYDVEILEKMSTNSIVGKRCSSIEVANYVQSEIGRVLGFECTALTRKDKYLMLAGNEGVVERREGGLHQK